MPKSHKRKKKPSRASKPVASRPPQALTVVCVKCNAMPGEECQPIRWDDNDFAERGVHTTRDASPAVPAQRTAPTSTPRVDLSVEIWGRLGIEGKPLAEYGLPSDPRGAVDRVGRVNAMAACAIAAAVGCDACLEAYLPALYGYEEELIEPWIVDAAGGRPPAVSDQARTWHETRHRLDPHTGDLVPDAAGYAGGTLAVVGARDMQALLDLTPWQVDCANYLGLFTPAVETWPLPRDAAPTWVRALVAHAGFDREEIIEYVGVRMPKGAVKTAEYLTERWGVPVTAADVEQLVEDRHLQPVGLYRGSRVYAPHHVDLLTEDMLDVDAATHVYTQWSERDEELLAAGTHPQSTPGYQRDTPMCPIEGCRSIVVDRPEDWGRACWRHLTADEQAAIAAERSDIPAKSGRYLLVDVERAIGYDCVTCGARTEVPCTGGVPHQPRILTARRWRRELRAAGQWMPWQGPPVPPPAERVLTVACPRCGAAPGRGCVTGGGKLAARPHQGRLIASGAPAPDSA
jgi:hypothetical protein